MTKNEKSLMEKLIKMSTNAGAENSEVIMAKGQGVYIGKKTASVSSSRTDNESLLKMVDRVISMVKLTPENPFCGIASKDQVAKNWSKINMLDPYRPTPKKLIDLALETEESARSVKGITNSEGAGAAWGKTDISMISTNGFFGHLERSSHSISVSVIAFSKGGWLTCS